MIEICCAISYFVKTEFLIRGTLGLATVTTNKYRS